MISFPDARVVGTQTPVALYLRVSSREQVEGYSLDAQRRAALDFCAARGWTVVVEFVDEGSSAHTDNLAKRPQFARMLTEAERGRFRVIVVHKMDRFARKLRVALECLERLGKSGVGVASVTEPDLDYSTPQGFLFLSMLGALAEWYSRNLSTETKKGWAERKSQGLYAGRLPFGVVKGSDGIPIPDTRPLDIKGGTAHNHAGLLLAFERAAEGATDAEVAEALNAAGYRPNATARRARFTRDATRAMLANRFYVGELPMGKRGIGGWLPGAHAPLVPVELFEAVQRQRSRRATQTNSYQVKNGSRVFALSGLVRCGRCGEPMHLEGAQRLTCWGRRQKDGCREKSVASRVVEQELGAYLRVLCLPDDAKERILAAYHRAKPEAAARDAERRGLEGQRRRLTDLYQMGEIERAEFDQRLAALKLEIGRLGDVAAHGRADVLERLQMYLLDAGAAWEEAEAGQRNKLARALFETITVRDGHAVEVRPRQEFLPYLALAEAEAPTANGSALSSESTLRRSRGDSNPRSRP